MVDGQTTVVWCDLLATGPGRCPGRETIGVYRDSIARRLTDLPVAGYPLVLRVRVPRYHCHRPGCERVIFTHDTGRLAWPAASTTLRCARFVLRGLVIAWATIAAVARELGRSRDTINTIAVAATELLATLGPARLDGLRVIGVDEHRWAHTGHAAGDGFVTVIVGLNGVVEHTGRARLLDLIEGRSAAAFSGWLAARTTEFRVPGPGRGQAMDGFTGNKNAATETVPDAVTVMDPFHVVALAGQSSTGTANASSRNPGSPRPHR